MRCEHRLGPLQMRVARQNYIQVAAATPDESFLQIDQQAIHAVDGIANPKPQVGADLIVATAGCMQLAADIAQAVDQSLLDVHVHVFQLLTELEFARLDLALDLLQPCDDGAALFGREQTDAGQHLGMRDRPANVVCVEPSVETHALAEPLHASINSRCEHAAAAGRLGSRQTWAAY